MLPPSPMAVVVAVALSEGHTGRDYSYCAVRVGNIAVEIHLRIVDVLAIM